MHCALILALTTAVTGTLRAADPTRQQDAAGQQQAPSPGQNSAAACRETAEKLPQLGKDPIREVIDAMTIEEKVHLLVGAGTSATDLEAAIIGQTRKLVPGAAGTTFPIERLGVPAIVFADGPAGIRISATRDSTAQTFYATQFPIGTLLAATWDTVLVRRVGNAMGEEVHEYGADVLLGPGMNLQRNPLNGRNFEYFSEDPLLTGKIAAAIVNGIQQQGVGTSVKHFVANNQETNRLNNNTIVPTRALREMYLRPFEIVVKEAQPWTIMTSYNKLNGTYTAERADLLTTVLRDEWGFKGLVTSDWLGGVNPVWSVQAGNDLLMPGLAKQRDSILKAIRLGTLSLHDVDRNVQRVLELILRSPHYAKYTFSNTPDLKASAAVARESAAEGMVLLKNDGTALPLPAQARKAALFGVTSYDFIPGGTGSGTVNSAYTVSLAQGLAAAGIKPDKKLQLAYESHIAAEKAARPAPKRWWAKQLRPQVSQMEVSDAEIARLARTQDAAVITIGRISGELLDRIVSTDYNLSEAEHRLIERVCNAFHKAGKKTVVVLNVCGPVETASWKARPDAILVAWLPGQEGGHAVADVLTGKVSPSGKLPMSFAMRYEDDPTAPNFPHREDYDTVTLHESMSTNHTLPDTGSKNLDYTIYDEGVFVGYRYFDTSGKEVSYPFGYGLGYTTFGYGGLDIARDGDDYRITCTIRNTGARAGREVVQLYVSAPGKDMPKPAKELRAFARTGLLQPGADETVTLRVPAASLASFDEASSSWRTEGGTYTFRVGASSADIRLSGTADVEAACVETVHPVILPPEKLPEPGRPQAEQ